MSILITDPFPEPFLSQIKALGKPVQYWAAKPKEEIYAGLADAEVIIINSKINLKAAELSQASNLKLVCRAGVGLDHFDLPLMKERGIKVVNAPGANAVPVGEQAIGMLLSLMHRINVSNREVKNGQWNREANRGTELKGKTVGIIGYGNTGSAFARQVSGFGVRILAYDKYKTGFGNEWVEECDMETLFSEADILTLHVPLTTETHYLVNDTFIAQFHRPIRLLNLSRGPVVEANALIQGLDSGKIIAAGLDVLENEKLATLSPEQQVAFDTLCRRENVLLTPHIGGWSHESLHRINSKMVAAVTAFYG